MFVTEDRATDSPGCDAVSVFDLALDAPIHRGRTHISPGRLGAPSDMSVVLATQTNTDQFIYALWRMSTDYSTWAAGSIREADSATFGGIAVLDDCASFLVATAAIDDRWLEDPNLRNHPPYHVRRYRMPAGRGGDQRVGQELGRVLVDGVAVEILLQRNQHIAHALTDAGTVYSIDVDSMTPISTPIRVAPPVGIANPLHGTPLNHIHAVLTPDERYLVTNRGRVAEISVADLRDRTSWTIPLRADLEVVGGVAIAGTGPNAGLLAVHAADQIAVYRFAPHGPLLEVGRVPVRVPGRYGTPNSDRGGAQLSIAWSGRGDVLIAATEAGTAEFVVLDVADGGQTITPRAYLTACTSSPNQPNDIITGAPNVPPPPSPPPTPVLTSPPTPSPPPSATVTPSATPTTSPSPTLTPTSLACATPTTTPTPSPTAAPVPAPAFLPLALGERCPADKQHVDVALVIDASTSMRDDRTASGHTKLDAALEAAAAFVGALGLPLDQVAVVGFNSSAWIEQPLTGRRSDVEEALARIPDAVREQTRIDLGIQSAHEEITGPRRLAGNRPVMIVLTDGLANPEPASTAVQRAVAAKGDEITIFTIGLGDEGALNVPELTQMATRPDYFYHAPDAEDLAAIYRAIAVELPCPGVRVWGRGP